MFLSWRNEGGETIYNVCLCSLMDIYVFKLLVDTGTSFGINSVEKDDLRFIAEHFVVC